MTRLLMIRHGQSEANLQRRFAGNYNADLSELGKKQARYTADFVFENYNVDAVYASDLMRAYKTGKAVAEKFGLTVRLAPGMREIRAGEWEGREFDELLQNSADYLHWREDIGSACPTGGESVRELYERVYKAVCKIAKANDGKTVVIATHATPIRALELKISGHGFDYMKNIPWVTNASVSEVLFENGNLTAVSMSQDKHLEDVKTTLPANV